MGPGLIGRMRGAVRVRTRLRAQRDAWRYRRTFTPELARDISSARRSAVAVIVHLYHVDLWPQIYTYLCRLPPSTADLFVTTAPDRVAEAQAVVSADMCARVIPTPNRGRDVLPFIKTAQVLQAAGYVSVLKVHSKKSVHHPDAAHWLQELLDQILPPHISSVEQVLATLADDRTGIIGPADSYYPSSHFLSANRTLIEELLVELRGPQEASSIMDHRVTDLGYFAGTMFWARLDAISALFGISPTRFPDEDGQADATMAHALERLLTFVPQLDDRSNYTVGQSGLQPLEVAS